MVDFVLEARFRSIAANAIREAKIAVGRADSPFSDDDAARLESIFQLLHLQPHIDTSIEHFPLTVPDRISEKAAKVTNLLKELPDDLRKAEEAIAFELPKAAKSA